MKWIPSDSHSVRFVGEITPVILVNPKPVLAGSIYIEEEFQIASQILLSTPKGPRATRGLYASDNHSRDPAVCC